MSNVVLNLCGLEALRRLEKASGLKRKRSERSDLLETSILSLMKKAMSCAVIGQNLGCLWLMVYVGVIL